MQAQSVVVSFSEGELDPLKTILRRCLRCCSMLLKSNLRGISMLQCTTDSEGGKWHGHLAVCNVIQRLEESIRGEAKTWQTLSKNVDEAYRTVWHSE